MEKMLRGATWTACLLALQACGTGKGTVEARRGPCAADTDCGIAVSTSTCCACPIAVLAADIGEAHGLARYGEVATAGTRDSSCAQVFCGPCQGTPKAAVCSAGNADGGSRECALVF